MKPWLTFARLFVGQMQDRTVPLRERWIRAWRMGMAGRSIAKGPPYKRARWIKWDDVG